MKKIEYSYLVMALQMMIITFFIIILSSVTIIAESQLLPPSHSVIQKALYNVIQARVMSRKRHSKMSKEAEAPGKTKAINPSCGTQDQNENGIFPKSDWEDAALHL